MCEGQSQHTLSGKSSSVQYWFYEIMKYFYYHDL